MLFVVTYQHTIGIKTQRWSTYNGTISKRVSPTCQSNLLRVPRTVRQDAFARDQREQRRSRSEFRTNEVSSICGASDAHATGSFVSSEGSDRVSGSPLQADDSIWINRPCPARHSRANKLETAESKTVKSSPRMCCRQLMTALWFGFWRLSGAS